MLPVRIGLASKSTSVDFASLVKVANALTLQITHDFEPIWNITGNVVALDDPDSIEPGIWPVYIVDEMQSGAAGFHQTEHNQPFAMVQYGPTWSLSASHEVLEMAADPSGNRLVAAPAVAIINNEVQDTSGKFEYLVEVCDPSEDDSCAYLIDGVLVSDFYTPAYFDPAGTAGARYSFSGKITRPRQVLPNGYLSWVNPTNNKLQQVQHFGAPQIFDLGDGSLIGSGNVTGARSLRNFVDSMTKPPMRLSRLHASAHATQTLARRKDFLAMAAPQRASHFTAALARAMAPRPVQAVTPPVDAAAALASNMAALERPGVFSVRTGWRYDVHGITQQRVIVATVDAARKNPLQAALPTVLNNVPVEVRAAGPLQTMRATNPARYLAVADARHELRQPDFDDEVFFDGNGQPIDHPAPLDAFEARRPAKPHVDYTPAPNVSLSAVEATMSLILHASPDAGWSQLSAFLAGVQQELVVGMYDFTSAHILAAVEGTLAGGKKLTLTLDHPAPNPTRDQTDEQTVNDLAGKLGGNFAQAWALTGSDPKAPVAIFPNAYHIKVAVREDDTFWLSSGNWNNSNQPEIDLSDVTAARQIAAKHDRDWHVIATSPNLARVFRAFLLHDYQVAHDAETRAAAAAATEAARRSAAPEVDVPAEVQAEGRAPNSFFTPKTISGRIRIQPLLTPDNYVDNVKQLIASTQAKFYMQTQYIHPSGKAADADHDALIAAVKALIDAGRDVRLITSQYQNDSWLEKLVDAGIPAEVLRRQDNVHNKGIIVDSRVVMVSSQNWSADGTLRNRDAGMIIYDPDAAAYFEQIFLHDWNYLASPVSAG